MWYVFSHNKFFSVAVVCTVIATAIVIATHININDWSYEIQEKRSNTAQSQMLIDNYNQQLDLYRGGFTEKSDAIFTVRPAKEDLVDFLDSMDEIVVDSEIRNFSLQNVMGGTSADKISYKAKFEATNKTLQKYLNAFVELPFYLEVTSLSFHKNEEQIVSGIGSAVVDFHIFINPN